MKTGAKIHKIYQIQHLISFIYNTVLSNFIQRCSFCSATNFGKSCDFDNEADVSLNGRSWAFESGQCRACCRKRPLFEVKGGNFYLKKYSFFMLKSWWKKWKTVNHGRLLLGELGASGDSFF